MTANRHVPAHLVWRLPLNRRDFLKKSAVALALASATPRLASGMAVGDEATPTLSVRRPVFHTRHIPIEHLNLKTPMAKDIVRNGLCDTIKPDMLKRLRDIGVELVEMRVVWWELEPQSGRFDWSRTLRDMDAVLKAGLKVGLFAWLQHPPTWYDPEKKAHARYRALSNNHDSTVISMWDPRTAETYDRLLGVCAEKLKDRLSFVYRAISGDYGELTYHLGVKHYKFSSPGNGSFWVGDRCARASFANRLREQYGSVDDLNKVWGTRFASFDDDLMPRMPFVENPLRQRDDTMKWCTDSIVDFTDRVCGLYQKHFPSLPGALPIGCGTEPLVWGQVKSRAAKVAARHGLTARWTGCACAGAYDLSHIMARRIASAAHFYGAPFGTEAALIINAENAANALYESQANGGSLVHDDPQNIFRAVEVQEALRPKLIVDPPVTPVALFYPLESEMLEMPGFTWKTFLPRCGEFRHVTDYDVCDSQMIAEGYLKRKRDLVFPIETYLREETARSVVEFAATGGRVWLYRDTQVHVLYQSASLADLAAQRELKIRDAREAGVTGLVRCAAWQEVAPHLVYHKFKLPDGGQPCYRTLHQKHESIYFPREKRFEIQTLNRG